MVPICENMLLAEGFASARALAVKFVKLYELSAELLAEGKQHYDWGLRALKPILTAGGAFLAAERKKAEGGPPHLRERVERACAAEHRPGIL